MATVDVEVMRSERVSTLAQQRVGMLAIVVMWNLFQQVNPQYATTTYQTWFMQSLRVMRGAMLLVRALSLAQYRLARALDLLETVSLDGSGMPVLLGDLRQDLVDVVEDSMVLGTDLDGDGLPDDDDISFFNDLVADLREEFADMAERLEDRDTRSADLVRDLGGEDDSVEESDEWVRGTLEDLLDEMINDPSPLPDNEEILAGWDLSDWVNQDDERWDEFFADADEDLERSIRKGFIEELENILQRRFTEDYSIEDAMEDIRRVADTAGLNASAWLERLAKERGRALVERIAANDNKLLLAARRTGPNPCAWCAMLAARGYVYTGTTAAGSFRQDTRRDGEETRTATSGGGWDTGSDGLRRYHENCQCTVVYRWQEAEQTDSIAQWLGELRRSTSDLNEYRRLLDEIRRENGGSLNLYGPQEG